MVITSGKSTAGRVFMLRRKKKVLGDTDPLNLTERDVTLRATCQHPCCLPLSTSPTSNNNNNNNNNVKDQNIMQQDIRKNIDKNLPCTTPCSLEDWTEEWKRIDKSGDRKARDRFALTGHYVEAATGETTRSKITFERDQVGPEASISALNDVDSVLGIAHNDLPFVPNVDLKYFMLQDHRQTLNSPLHIPPVKIDDQFGPLSVEPHKVPNARFLEGNNHLQIRIAFPRLARAPGASNTLSQREHEQLFDLAVGPAGAEEVPLELSGVWPPTWRNEKFRAEDVRNAREAGEGETGSRGKHLQQTELTVHSQYVNAWIRRIRELVDALPELEWAQSFFFIIQMRGLKTLSQNIHIPPEEAPFLDGEQENLDPTSPRVVSVERILSIFETYRFEVDHWFIDIGMNIRLPRPTGRSLCPLPAVAAHASILSHLLGIDMATCTEWVENGGHHYQRDELAGLKALAGFRFLVPANLDLGIYYIQLYTSEKILIYNLNLPHHSKRVTSWQLLEAFDKWRESHFQPLLQVFQDAAASHEMYMRLEVRVEYHQYPHTLLRIPNNLVASWMYAAESHVYWGWKYLRLTSIYSVLRLWIGARSSVTMDSMPEYLSLFVSLVWMANGLVNRPDDGGTWNEIRDASSVHAISNAGSLVPVWPLRAHFLHSLKFKDNRPPSMSVNRVVSMKTLLYVCSRKLPALTESALHELVVHRGSQGVEDMQVDAPPNLQEAQKVYHSTGTNKRQLIVARSRMRLPNLFTETLPDLHRQREDEDEDDDDEERPRGTPLSQLVTDVLCDLPTQIFEKAPVAKAGHSWCTITRGSADVTPDAFQDMEFLALAFPSRQVFPVDGRRWDETVAALLPTITESKKDSTGGEQGLHCLSARIDFATIQRKVPADYQVKIVNVARQYVNENWVWLPYGKPKSRIWGTGKTNAKGLSRFGPFEGGPWIVLNPNLS
ncbi:DEAD (Asp-Glu-Ala-Asp) box polypeptide 58 [Ceratobasidium sp. AG-Ba]|nr:DEAD (Asp-Glu-Ala-Asp) box polypeptide 58 [Ceratobasidium sp. AG-Ba]